MMRKILGPLLGILLLAGLGYAIYTSVSDELGQSLQDEVLMVGGSEKAAFFQNETVQKALDSHDIIVKYEKAGSRQIATDYDLSRYDFAFPAGTAAAEKIQQSHKSKKGIPIFYTPMVVASWQPIVEILHKNGLVTQRDQVYYLDMLKLYDVMQAGTRWKTLEGSSAYPVDKPVLVTTTDVRKSNSAAMYLALMSYLANASTVVQNSAMANEVLPKVLPLFLGQGFSAYSSAAPFEDYLLMGAGKIPLLFTYESQFIQAAEMKRIRNDMVLLYPEPTIFAKHNLIPLSDKDVPLPMLLADNVSLQELAVHHGFRNKNNAYFDTFTQGLGVQLPAQLYNVIEMPSYEVLEGMIQKIESHY